MSSRGGGDLLVKGWMISLHLPESLWHFEVQKILTSKWYPWLPPKHFEERKEVTEQEINVLLCMYYVAEFSICTSKKSLCKNCGGYRKSNCVNPYLVTISISVSVISQSLSHAIAFSLIAIIPVATSPFTSHSTIASFSLPLSFHLLLFCSQVTKSD